jgi:hypothetical protein
MPTPTIVPVSYPHSIERYLADIARADEHVARQRHRFIARIKNRDLGSVNAFVIYADDHAAATDRAAETVRACGRQFFLVEVNAAPDLRRESDRV